MMSDPVFSTQHAGLIGISCRPISTEDAMARLAILPDYDPGGGPGPCVHTFLSFIGAHWYVEGLRALIEEKGAYLLEAPIMRHGIVIPGDRSPLLVETTSGGPYV